ncbi:hypothetical protein [Deinococcus psychrotolerans]|uniref:hypothetical protein n=1 Tax=Deinococcus psychrotolerans TaxID=2489213 RepID=UPI0013DE62C8|nr:hypothetical protein [Deinococcus psychrotolerans]
MPWVQLNSTLVLQAQDQQILNCSGILGIDAVFIPKYGNHTPDLASYWVVAVVWPGSRKTQVLFSTSITMTAAIIIALYRARFSMEFPFRDGKRPSVLMGAVLAKTQFAGLSECQSRQMEALHFHWNMAMTAVSAARLSQLSDQRDGPLVFSMEDEKRRAYNAFFAERILSILMWEQTEQKCEDLLADLLSLGVKAA